MGPPLKLSDAILVGHAQHQVKFSELTIDMFRYVCSMVEMVQRLGLVLEHSQ